MRVGDIVYCESTIDGDKEHPYLVTEISYKEKYVKVLLITHTEDGYDVGKKLKLDQTDIPGMYIENSFLGLFSRTLYLSFCKMSFKNLKVTDQLKQKLQQYGHF
jgi:hypothetical protein